jgi:GNAT superfamily N-acetyltransferase
MVFCAMTDSPARSSRSVPDVRIEEVGMEAVPVIRTINVEIFEETRIINRLDRDDLIMLLAYVGEDPVGFKVGYRENSSVFYSAKGGVLPQYRRRGIARWLLYEMMNRAREKGYSYFAFDTLPNLHHGMTVLGLTEGFEVVGASFSDQFDDYILRFEKSLS